MMTRVPARIVDAYKALYGLDGWKMTVRVSSRKSANCGETIVRRPYNEATITLFSRAVRESRRSMPHESMTLVLQHEFAHVLLESHADTAVAAELEGERLWEWVEATVDHLASVLHRLGGDMGMVSFCKEEGF